MRTTIIVMVAGMLSMMTSFAADAAKPMSKKEVAMLIEKANTPADHMKLAKYYNQQADKFEMEAKEHAEMGEMYKKRPSATGLKTAMSPDTTVHCEYIAESLRNASKKARELSAEHAKMADK